MHTIAETSEHANTRMEQIENTLNAMNVMVANDIKALHEKTAYLQGAIESGGAKSGGSARKFGILESKAIQGIKPLGTDKVGFRMWNEKLINIVSQVRPGARKLFAAITEFVDQDNDLDDAKFATEFEDSGAKQELEDRGTSYDDISEDLYVLLTDKTGGEAAIRVRGGYKLGMGSLHT